MRCEDSFLAYRVPLREIHPGPSVRLGRSSRLCVPGHLREGIRPFPDRTLQRTPASALSSQGRTHRLRCTLNRINDSAREADRNLRSRKIRPYDRGVEVIAMGRTKPSRLARVLVLIGVSLAAPAKPSAGQGDPPTTSAPGPVADRGTLPAGEFRLGYRIEGKGRPAIVIGSSVYYPRVFSQGLRKHLRLVFLDHRGFAPSPGDRGHVGLRAGQARRRRRASPAGARARACRRDRPLRACVHGPRVCQEVPC